MAEALNKLTKNFAKMQNQPLATVALSTMDWFDGTDNQTPCLCWSRWKWWLKQPSTIRGRYGKTKGSTSMQCTQNMQFNLAAVTKLLIENYSDTPYVSDVMVVYNRISQAEDKSVSQYLICAKDYLEQINHTSRLASMDGSGLNHISLVQGLSDNYIRRRASKDAENWKTMADAFDSIAKIMRATGKTKAHNEPRYEKPTDIHAISNSFNNSERGSFNRYWGTYRNNHVNSRNNSQAVGNNLPWQNSSKELVCYHCAGPHYITKCSQYQKDKDKYKHTTQQVKQNL